MSGTSRRSLPVLAWIAVLWPGAQVAMSDSASEAPIHTAIAGLKEVRIEPVRRVRGKEFKWDHGVQIALPASYGQTDRSYPVLWITDGPMYFELAVKAVNYDLRHHLPEMIVVAIGPPPEELGELANRRGYEFSASSVRGFKGFGSTMLEQQLAAAEEKSRAAGEAIPPRGGAGQFLAFLVEELRPRIAHDYRVTDDHTLFGDSGGGVFCVYVLLASPQAFNRYICGSPNLYAGDFELFRMEERYAKTHNDLNAIVFLGAGEAEMLDPNDRVRAWSVLSATARMVEILGMRKYPSLKLHARIFPGEDHASVAPLNLSSGLRTVWQQ